MAHKIITNLITINFSFNCRNLSLERIISFSTLSTYLVDELSYLYTLKR